MRSVTVTVGPLAAASANNIALSQTPTTTVTLNGSLVIGGVAVLDTPRRILVTPAGDESANTFTIVGTDRANNTQTEVLVGGNATATYTNLDFATVKSITLKNAAAGAITVGTNGIASSGWIHLDQYCNPPGVALQCVVTGTVNYSVQQTLDSPNGSVNAMPAYALAWLNTADAAVVNATATAQSNYAYAPVFTRVTLNSGTGSVRFTAVQLG
jgi:hypothetical protein